MEESTLQGGDSERIPHERLDVEWAALIAIREMLGIAHKGKATPTYEQALEFAKNISPSLFDSESK